jgi:hypothetical protein
MPILEYSQSVRSVVLSAICAIVTGIIGTSGVVAPVSVDTVHTLTTQSDRLDGFAWSTLEGEQWSRSGWRAITMTRGQTLGGAREVEGPCANPLVCLRREGGRLCRCVTLLIADRRIARVAELRQIAAPLDTADEAADFIGMLEADLLMDNGRLAGHVREIDDGWLVQLVRRNTFGCNDHQPTGFVVRVGRGGEGVQEVGSQRPAPSNPRRPFLCVD